MKAEQAVKDSRAKGSGTASGKPAHRSVTARMTYFLLDKGRNHDFQVHECQTIDDPCPAGRQCCPGGVLPPPNANLEQARTNYSGLQANPQASKVAALETKDASDYLDKADKAYLDKEDPAKVDQLAYLTNQRVEVAKQTIATACGNQP
jgi:hypothetical protein